MECKFENSTSTMAIMSVNIESDGGHIIGEKGVCYDKDNKIPNIDNLKVTAGSGSGDFQVVLKGLSPKTTYYARAYFIYKNTEGKDTPAYSSNVESFETRLSDSEPLLTTIYNKNTISHNSVEVGGKVIDNGGFTITAQGVCYKIITPDDTAPADTNDAKLNIPLDGNFHLLEGLEPETTYNIRAYAVNELGIGYGSEGGITFTTPALFNDWLQLKEVGDQERHIGFSFSDGTHVYVGGGISDHDPRKDFLMYDPDTKTWTQKQDLQEGLRGAVAFWVNGNGYVGTGIDRFGKATNKFYKYNPNSDTWSVINTFPGEARANAVAFVIAGKAYIGTGSSESGGFYHDFYEFNPVTETFSPAGDMGIDNNRDGAVAFSINGKGYCGFGFDGSYYRNDLFEFNPTNPDITTRWKKVTTSGANPPPRRYAVAFAIKDIGYIGTGINEAEFYNDFYKFNGTTSTWTQIPNKEGKVVERTQAIGTATDGRGYIGTGRTNRIHLKDFWEYTPAP